MLFEPSHLDAIARALADNGLTGGETPHLLRQRKMADQDPGQGVTKWKRLQAASAGRQNLAGNARAIQEFVRRAMSPANHLDAPGRHEAMRFRLNQALLLAGMQCTEEVRL